MAATTTAGMNNTTTRTNNDAWLYTGLAVITLLVIAAIFYAQRPSTLTSSPSNRATQSTMDTTGVAPAIPLQPVRPVAPQAPVQNNGAPTDATGTTKR